MSNASHAKEPSMEEILASIRRIIESGDERPSLPGLSLEPRERKAGARTSSFSAANAAAGSGVEAGQAEGRGASRLRPAVLDVEEAPARIFQPANAALADADPFEELATWEFSPVEDRFDAASGEMAAIYDELDEMAGDVPTDEDLEIAGAVPEADIVATSVPAIRDEANARIESLPPLASRSSPSLAEAYGAARVAPRAGGAVAARGPFAETPVPSADDGEPAEARVAAVERAVEPSHGAIDVPAPEFDIPDFSLEFDEADFSAALLSQVDAADALDVTSDDDESDECAATGVPVSVIAEASTLMSQEAGSQVAAAFDDLARAIRDGQMKSMEEMAREMLRPMLQEWLDDNLPRLVETLVREEIERVARGGRR